jgi:hypothetical protein
MLEIYEYIYPITNGQTSFKPVNTITGTTVDVFRNGTIVQANQVINGNIVIPIGLALDEYLMVKTESSKTVTIGDNGTPYLKRYNASSAKLRYNQRYTVDFQVDEIPVHLDFTSRYDPFYTSAKFIRTDLQDVVTLTDDEINFLIWDNSYRVLIAMQGAGDLDYALPVPYQLKNPNTIPYNIQQHVRYSVEFDILNAMYLLMTGKGGRIMKQLGDMIIDKTVTVPKLEDLLKGVRDKLNQYTLQNNFVKTMTKGGTGDPWPVATRRSF